MRRERIALFLSLALLFFCAGPMIAQAIVTPVAAQAVTAPAESTPAESTPERFTGTAMARPISTKAALTQAKGIHNPEYLYNDDLLQYTYAQKDTRLTLEHSEGIGYVYLIYQREMEVYTIQDNTTGKVVMVGTHGFLHELLDLQALFGTVPTSVTLHYPISDFSICEVMLYTPGQLPDTVQQWKAPAQGETDLLLFSTHGDDEQLFFAGILPYYAGALGYNVQVVYLTGHQNNSTVRMHEMLNGLWAVGCDVYPVFGSYDDFNIDSLEGTYSRFRELGVTREDIIGYCVEALRRFQPKVIVTHDFNGEYGQGQHMVYADCVAAALESAADPEQYPQSAREYGIWDTPKAYFHLYEENQIVMDWDTPMVELDGMTPFQVTREKGFACHESQRKSWLTTWLNYCNEGVVDRAIQISTYNPCYYGLYRSTVGPDVDKNDFFENVTTYAQDSGQPLAQPGPALAQRIDTKTAITHSEGFPNIPYLYNDDLVQYTYAEKSASLTLEHSEGIGYLYMIYHQPMEVYSVRDNTTGQIAVGGSNGFLHELLDLEALFGTVPTSVTVQYPITDFYICEVLLYTPGQLPDTVQRWKPPVEGQADLLLLSTHGDDEQLFFAGILPYYAGVLDYNVQVAYFTGHQNNSDRRMHEMLNGLWAVGCDVYPVFGTFDDFLTESTRETYWRFSQLGVSKEDILRYCTELLRRFKPKVVIAHDFYGEYGHGQHMVYAECAAEALEAAADPAQFPQSAQRYGTWDTPKAYFHLYWENQIVMDWDRPLAELDGMTPFQVTQKIGFPCHTSQQWTWFPGWINYVDGYPVTRASQLNHMSPCEYGLYRSTVGPDEEKKDFFENVTTYGEDYRQWLEENPPVTTPPETTPPETTPPETTPEATTPPVTTPQVTPAVTTPGVTTPGMTTPPVSAPEPAAPDSDNSLAAIGLGITAIAAAGIFGLAGRKRRT